MIGYIMGYSATLTDVLLYFFNLCRAKHFKRDKESSIGPSKQGKTLRIQIIMPNLGSSFSWKKFSFARTCKIVSKKRKHFWSHFSLWRRYLFSINVVAHKRNKRNFKIRAKIFQSNISLFAQGFMVSTRSKTEIGIHVKGDTS